MIELDNKSKIIIGIIAILIFFIIIYFVFTNMNNIEYEFSENEMPENNQVAIEEVTKNEIIVHIAGAVNHEGIVKTEEGSRIADIIEKAEGLKEDASLKNINLAYIVEDGQKIYIPTIEEENEKKEEINDEYEVYDKSFSKININTASKSDLEKLSGIGASTAENIINYRKENGKFESIEEIKNVSGVGNSKYLQIKDEICVK